MSSTHFGRVLQYGTFYHPASKRYGGGTIVVCDRCGAKPLLACIGSSDRVDLCLPCANALAEQAHVDVSSENIVGKTAEFVRANFPGARVYSAGSMLTMDFVADRLNAEKNTAGVITRVWFG